MPGPDARLPAELEVSLTPDVRVLAGGTVLVGGQPLRALSLTAGGAEVVSGWRTPGAIGAGRGRHDFARRLLDAGMLELHAPAAVAPDELTFVVPVRDRPEQLERCLRAVMRGAPAPPRSWASSIRMSSYRKPPPAACWPISRIPASPLSRHA
jgi:hypothetical protein